MLEEGEVWFTGTEAFPSVIKSIEDVPKARVVQLASGESTRYSRQYIDMRRSNGGYTIKRFGGGHLG